MRSLKQIRGINAYRQGTLFRAHCLTGNNREMEYPAAGRLAPYESFGLPLGASRRTQPDNGSATMGRGHFSIRGGEASNLTPHLP
jgi:hypothetical protein